MKMRLLLHFSFFNLFVERRILHEPSVHHISISCVDIESKRKVDSKVDFGVNFNFRFSFVTLSRWLTWPGQDFPETLAHIVFTRGDEFREATGAIR